MLGAILFEDRQRRRVIRDQVVLPQKDIELVKIEHVGIGLEAGDVKDDVEILGPVVDLGDV